MVDASSNTMMIRLPWLCRPANASVLCADHGTWSMRQVFSWSGSTLKMAVAVSLNQWRMMHSRYHFASSAQVFVRSCVSVLAVTTPLVSTNVDSAQRISQETRADLPMPWPEATAIWIASHAFISPARNDSPSSVRISVCQISGPSCPSSSPCPQSNE
ncbi:hypothetical protein D3C85_1312040 [compost metagenome]